jgi:hypothetical protein
MLIGKNKFEHSNLGIRLGLGVKLSVKPISLSVKLSSI